MSVGSKNMSWIIPAIAAFCPSSYIPSAAETCTLSSVTECPLWWTPVRWFGLWQIQNYMYLVVQSLFRYCDRFLTAPESWRLEGDRTREINRFYSLIISTAITQTAQYCSFFVIGQLVKEFAKFQQGPVQFWLALSLLRFKLLLLSTSCCQQALEDTWPKTGV